MEHDFLGRVVSVANFREQRNIGKGSPVFPDEMFQTEIRVPFFSKSSLTPSSRLRGHFSENETDLYK